MNFEEALNEKNQAMKTVMETGHSYNYLIVPEILKERDIFLKTTTKKRTMMKIVKNIQPTMILVFGKF